MKRKHSVFILFFGLGLIPALGHVNLGKAEVQGNPALLQGPRASLQQRLGKLLGPRTLLEPQETAVPSKFKALGADTAGVRGQKKAPWQKNLESQFLALGATQRSA